MNQISAIIGAEAGTCAMVSRSEDGDFLVSTLRINGLLPIRGPTRPKGKSKGGGTALQSLVENLRGGDPAYLAVNGPRGTRNYVNRGIAKLELLELRF